ncbi:hypothetical protein ACFL0Z_00270 [Patescibacteria group bacterium]
MALSRTTRRFIVGGLIIAFCVIAPALVLYARGFRYDFVDQEVRKVGMIMLAYDPLTATATVDDQSAPFDLTALGYDRFTNLAEGSYFIEVAEEGYHSWSKNLDIEPEVVTWARYVTLFLTDLKPLDLTTLPQITAQDFSPDRKWLCATGIENDSSVLLITSLTAETDPKRITLSELSPRLSDNLDVTKITFAPDSTHILLTLQGEKNEIKHVVFSRELTSDEPVTIIEETLPDLTEVRWHPSTPSIVYALQNQDLYRIALNELNTKKLASEVRGFDPNASGLYFLRSRDEQIRDEPQASLKRMGLDGSNPETLSGEIELTDSYEIATSANNRLAVLTDTGHLYIVERENTERIAMNVNKMEWGIDNDEEDSTDELLLYANLHEIYIYDPLIQNSDAITRYTEGIANVIWYVGNYKYIIFTVGGKLKIIELDERDKRNVADLWKTSDDESIEPDTLYIDNDAEHIFLRIRTPEKGQIRDFTIRE